MKAFLTGAFLFMSMNLMAAEIQVKVGAMVCSMCAQGISKKFKARPEVKDLEVNMDTKTVIIKTHEGKDLKDSEVFQLVKEAGYHADDIKRM